MGNRLFFILLYKLPVGSGRHTAVFAKALGQIALRGKAGLVGNI